MSIDDFEPLTAEERDLAAKLGLGKRTYAPSPEIEQAIRSDAHHAVRSADRARAQPMHWLRYGGVAAACVLALGVAWKTLKTPQSTEMDGYRSAASQAAEVAAPAKTIDETVDDRPVVAQAAESDKAVVEAPAAIEAVPDPTARIDTGAEISTHAATKARAADTPTVDAVENAVRAAEARSDTDFKAAEAEVDRAASMQSKQRAPVSASPQLDTANAARRANDAATESSAKDGVLSRQAAASAARPPPPQPAPAAAAAPAPVPSQAPPATQSDAITLENGYDPRPPKTTEAQDVQVAWLKRIRALMQAGKKEEAAASLEAWRKRYPEATVPADLAPLGKVNTDK
ncbi:hypothetical protein G7069_08120 [Lysobacter sp. HDW10]|uniref:hypothetical protein n=1 Tax=Lysobacter sp. HDW10 TaxID=2714936 RepID=UPI001408EC68|nr:hypothetical protein [Lysobacter sp. HDW10]QIK81559.1 hypothetical protein G7069_08120 [Lysobacter sp. HDW10]